jgi:excisionase family DNA binding protein
MICSGRTLVASTTRQAAQRLGVTERQVQRYVHAGLLEARQFGDYVTAPDVSPLDIVSGNRIAFSL